MRRWVLSGVSFVFFLAAFLMGSGVVFGAPMPTFPTLPLSNPQGDLVTWYPDGSLVSNSDKSIQYIQVTPADTNKKGAVWFNQPISFDKDFEIEMYIYIDPTGTGDGMGVLLKDSSETKKWIGDHDSGSLGFLGLEDYRTILGQSEISGAIPRTFAVEFDNYWNENRMDQGVPNSDHVAYSWPGLKNSYSPTFAGIGGWTNHLNHHEVQTTKLATGQWRKFTMSFKKTATNNSLTYQLEGLPSKTIEGFVGGDHTKKETFSSGKAYLGFAGSTGGGVGATQEMAVTFTKVPNVLNMTMNQKIYYGNDQTPFFDSATLKDADGTVPSKTVTDRNALLRYATDVAIDGASSLSSIGQPTFKVKVPDQIQLLNDQAHPFKIDGQPATATLDSTGSYWTVTANTTFNRGTTHTLEYYGKPTIPASGELSVTNEADVNLKGATFGDISLPKDTSNNPLKYQIKAVAQLALSQTVTKINSAGETEVYNSSDDDPSEILLTSQKDQLKRTLTAKMSEGSTITDVGNAVFTIQATTGLTIDKASFKVNNTAIPAEQITEANGIWTIDTKQPVKIDSQVTIEYLMTPVWETNTNTVRQLDLTATVKADISELTQANLQVPVNQKASPTITLKTKADVLPATATPVPAVAFADLAKGQWQAISINKDLPFADSVDQDENSTDMSYYLKALPDKQEYHPDTDPGVKFADRTGRTALNDGSAQAINGMKLPKAEIAKIGAGKHYVAVYATDHEGNLSNVQYLLLNILSDKLTLDKVPDLSFDDGHLFNSNDIAALADQTDTRDYALKQDKVGFKVTATKFLGFDGFIDNSQDKATSGEILITDARTDRTKGWVLTLDVPDITEAKANGRSLSPEAAIVLQLGIKGKDPVNVLYGKYGDATTQELTLKQQGNTAQTITANKTVEIAKGAGNTPVSDIISTKVSIDPATTYLRIKKGSQNDFTKKTTFQLQLHWVLKTVE